MAQKSIIRRDKEIISTSSRQKTNESQEMCLMAIEASGTHLVGEGNQL